MNLLKSNNAVVNYNYFYGWKSEHNLPIFYINIIHGAYTRCSWFFHDKNDFRMKFS